MNKATLYAGIFSVVLFGFLYLMFTNKTLVFKSFEVQLEQEDFFSGEKARGVHMSNLNCVLEGNCVLTFKGWIKLFLIFIGLPAAMFLFVRWRINRKTAKAIENQQKQNLDS